MCMSNRHNLSIDDEIFSLFEKMVGKGKVSKQVEQMMLNKLKLKKVTKWVKDENN